MAFRITKDLPSAEEVVGTFPMTPAHRIQEHRDTGAEILSGRDSRLLMVVGPCSAWPIPAVERYAEKLAQLQEEVRERLFLVLRCYTQKPRTTLGWPGPLTQPDPRQPADIERGIWQCREMMHKVGKMLPVADEMLFTGNEGYFVDALSYLAIGARSSSDQEHRFVASGMFSAEGDCPVGIKNPEDGNLEIAVNGVECAQHPHTFAWRRHQVETDGNPWAHVILRGAKDKSNYDPASIALAARLLRQPEREIRNPAVIVDASHDNCRNGHGKDPLLQQHVVESVLSAKSRGYEGYDAVKGFMVESFLKRGNQKISPTMDMDGLSATDPCLGWDDTQRLIRDTADQLDRALSKSVV